MSTTQNPFDKEVDRLLGLMSELDPTGDDYKKAAEALRTLCEARSKKAAYPVDPEVIISAAVNIIGIVLILNHENLHVISSRAISFVRK